MPWWVDYFQEPHSWRIMKLWWHSKRYRSPLKSTILSSWLRPCKSRHKLWVISWPRRWRKKDLHSWYFGYSNFLSMCKIIPHEDTFGSPNSVDSWTRCLVSFLPMFLASSTMSQKKLLGLLTQISPKKMFGVCHLPLAFLLAFQMSQLKARVQDGRLLL